MKYPYHCHCGHDALIDKKMADSARKENCPTCKSVMERVYTPPLVHISHIESQYNPAFGKVIHNKTELKNELARHEGETGEKLYEVGNDTMKSIKVKRKEYTTDNIYVDDY